MPWRVERTSKCPVGKPFGVVKEANGEVVGCHATRSDARSQQAALYASEATKSIGFVPEALCDELELDGDETYQRRDAEHEVKGRFEEQLHPRDRHGRWSHVLGGGSGSELPAPPGSRPTPAQRRRERRRERMSKLPRLPTDGPNKLAEELRAERKQPPKNTESMMNDVDLAGHALQALANGVKPRNDWVGNEFNTPESASDRIEGARRYLPDEHPAQPFLASAADKTKSGDYAGAHADLTQARGHIVTGLQEKVRSHNPKQVDEFTRENLRGIRKGEWRQERHGWAVEGIGRAHVNVYDAEGQLEYPNATITGAVDSYSDPYSGAFVAEREAEDQRKRDELRREQEARQVEEQHQQDLQRQFIEAGGAGPDAARTAKAERLSAEFMDRLRADPTLVNRVNKDDVKRLMELRAIIHAMEDPLLPIAPPGSEGEKVLVQHYQEYFDLLSKLAATKSADHWTERLHPRDRSGRFSPAAAAAAAGGGRLDLLTGSERRRAQASHQPGWQPYDPKLGKLGRGDHVMLRGSRAELVITDRQGDRLMVATERDAKRSPARILAANVSDVALVHTSKHTVVPRGPASPRDLRDKPVEWNAADRKAVTNVVAEEKARHPELETGPRPLVGVGFVGDGPDKVPSGMDPEDYNRAGLDLLLTNAEGGTLGTPDHQVMVFNDSRPSEPPPPGHRVSLPTTAETVARHEVGHAWFNEHIKKIEDDVDVALQLLLEQDVNPPEIAEKVGRYAASDPREALAELFAMKYTDGVTIPPPLDAKFDEIERRLNAGQMEPDQAAILRMQLRKGPIGSRRGTPVPAFVSSGPLADEMLQASDENVKAGAWEATNPELDHEPPEPTEAELEGLPPEWRDAAGKKGWTERLHPRDRRGRFARDHGGGGGGGGGGRGPIPDYGQLDLGRLEDLHSDLTYGRRSAARLTPEERKRRLAAVEHAISEKRPEMPPPPPESIRRAFAGASAVQTPQGARPWGPGRAGKAVYIPSQHRVIAWEVQSDGFPHHGDVLEQQAGLQFHQKARDAGLKRVSPDNATVRSREIAHSVTIAPDGSVRYQAPLSAARRYQEHAPESGDAQTTVAAVVKAIPGTHDSGEQWTQQQYEAARDAPWRRETPLLPHANTADDAMFYLSSGQHVSIKGEILRDVLDQIEQEKDPVNLELLHLEDVDHGNLFDAHETETPRSAMPQVPGDAETMQSFMKFLSSHGMAASKENVRAEYLHATQNELTGQAVSKISKKYDPARAGLLLTDRNGAVLDGHHRWASAVVYEMQDQEHTVEILRIDGEIRELLTLAEEFDKQAGIAHEEFGKVKVE